VDAPLVSIVTISYNQASFLEEALRSVLAQDHPRIEYIVVDPGSTDGSREIIERHRERIAHVVFEPDRGAADGLNRGFALARGEYFGYLNSDDVLLPGAVREMAGVLAARPDVDVVAGDCLVLDASGRTLRRAYSDRFGLRAYAHGASVLIQPSSLFRARAFRAAGGFNADNRSNWDGELFVAMAETGARFATVRRCWSGYRVHGTSITGSRSADAAIRAYGERMYRRIVKRPPGPFTPLERAAHLALKYVRTPGALVERLRHGPVYGAAVGVRQNA
jgi:glycosyltransferase involved in cell wall biosynthesis